MAQYIDKSALVAEIEKRIKELQNLHKENEEKLDSIQKTAILLCIDECRVILSLLNTIEVKEANSVQHDAIELPDETSLILLSLKDGNFILADEKTAYIRELVDKWCYISDI